MEILGDSNRGGESVLTDEGGQGRGLRRGRTSDPGSQRPSLSLPSPHTSRVKKIDSEGYGLSAWTLRVQSTPKVALSAR